MGVDARLFVKLKGRQNWLKPEDVAKTAYALASTLGSERFLITIGQDWAIPFGTPHHALSIVAPMSEETAKEYETPELAGKVVWFQDGPFVEAREGEQFVQIHLMDRYYHEDYARGDWPGLRSVIEWCWLRFPTGEVWYGGDSSGCCAELMTPERVAALNKFYLETGNRTYQRAFATPTDRHTGRPAPTCPTCGVMTINCGGGQGESFWYCDGCGGKVVTSKDGARWLKRGQDFFERGRAPAAS